MLANNPETHCIHCNKPFNTRKDLTDHNAYMRRKGNTLGHETKTVQSMATPSLVGEKLDERLKDF